MPASQHPARTRFGWLGTAGAGPVISLTTCCKRGGTGRVRHHRQVPARGGGPGRDPVGTPDGGPGRGGGPVRDEAFRLGNRPAYRACYPPVAGAATAGGDVSAGRRG